MRVKLNKGTFLHVSYYDHSCDTVQANCKPSENECVGFYIETKTVNGHNYMILAMDRTREDDGTWSPLKPFSIIMEDDIYQVK